MTDKKIITPGHIKKINPNDDEEILRNMGEPAGENKSKETNESKKGENKPPGTKSNEGNASLHSSM